MILNYKHWKTLFLVCLGITVGSAFCMKWMESDFLHNGKLFTIIGLEITYSKEKIIEIFSGVFFVIWLGKAVSGKVFLLA